MSDLPYIPPEEVRNTRNKKNANRSCKKSAEEMGKEDGVVGAVDDAEQELGGVVSHLLTSSMISIHLYELFFYMNSYPNNSKCSSKKIANMQGKEDGVVGAVNDAEQEQRGVVSHTLISYTLHEFIFYLKSFIIQISCIK